MSDHHDGNDGSSSSDAVETTCPSCGSPITPEDAFCENCGTTLRADALAASPDARTANVGAPGGDGRVAGPSGESSTGADASTGAISAPGRRCQACAGEILDDGFCGTCGQRAPSPRDHWEETPTSWLAGVCDKGIVHARNEDALALGGRDDFGLGVLVVCDGVTTAPDSDRAALAAARAACGYLLANHVDATGSDAAVVDRDAALVVGATAAAHAAAVGVARALGDPTEPPSCTFVAALLTGAVLTVGWCGDSRAYWFPDGEEPGEQLTVDHSLGTEMIRSGLSRDEAEADPRSHTITRWLGADSVSSTPEVVSRRLSSPGWLLLCSDGLWNYASSVAAMTALVAEVGRRAEPGAEPLAVASALVAWANEQGGHDNITAALARMDPSLR